jgi:hypothetical protein
MIGANWPEPHARARATAVMAEAASWTDGQQIEHYRAWREADLRKQQERKEDDRDGRRQRRLEQLEDDRWARHELDAQGWQPPDATARLDAELALPRSGEPHRIPGLAGMNHNVLLAGPRKTGKTQ